MAVTLDSLIEDIRPMIGVPITNQVLTDALRWTARDFLRRTRWLRETINDIDVVDGQSIYTLTPSDTTNTEVFGIQAVMLENVPLDPVAHEDVSFGTEGFYFIDFPDDLRLTWTPADNIADALDVRILLSVKRTATALPDSVVNRWDNVLSAGTLYRLMSMQKVAWADPGLAGENKANYLAGIEAGLLEAEAQAKTYHYGYRATVPPATSTG